MIFGLVFLTITALSLYAVSLLNIKTIKRTSLGLLIISLPLFVLFMVAIFNRSPYKGPNGIFQPEAAGVFFVPAILLIALAVIIFLIAFIKERSKK